MIKRFLKLLAVLAMALPLADTVSAVPRVIDIKSPKMKVFLPPDGLATGKALVDLPGGGYSHHAINHEGYDWAPFFNQRGLVYAVLEYSFPKGNPEIPIADVEAAFKVLADSAAAWKFNPDSIGIMGSSAGGHLASTMATRRSEVCKPAFQLLFYPVISMNPELTQSGTHDNLLGKNATKEIETKYSSELNVTPQTPEALILFSSDDHTVQPVNGTKYYEALLKAGVPASLIIYPSGGHGWGYRERFKYHDNVLNEISTWLKNL